MARVASPDGDTALFKLLAAAGIMQGDTLVSSALFIHYCFGLCFKGSFGWSGSYGFYAKA